ncbi:MAG: transcriptional regulator [Fervidicoccaceae archaeon]|nr:transcriptional regulator [Fervidicoccaceae archaeon]
MSLGLKELVVPVEVPVSPLSKKEVKLLETALIIGTVFREDVIKQIISKEEVTTCVDSLAVAAAALAMEKAGCPVSKIAEELGRTEATIRKHLKGETKAGQLVRETYEMLLKKQLKLNIPFIGAEEAKEDINKLKEELEKIRKELEEAKKENQELRAKLDSAASIMDKLLEIANELSGILKK